MTKRNLRPIPQEIFHHGSSDALRAAGDQSHFPVETHAAHRRAQCALLYVGVQSEGGVLMSTTTVNTDGQVSFYKLSFTPKR